MRQNKALGSVWIYWLWSWAGRDCCILHISVNSKRLVRGLSTRPLANLWQWFISSFTKPIQSTLFDGFSVGGEVMTKNSSTCPFFEHALSHQPVCMWASGLTSVGWGAGGKLEMEGGKVIKCGEDFFFFFFFFFCFSLFWDDENLSWVYQNGNFLPGTNISRREKNQEKWLCPLRKICLLHPWCEPLFIFLESKFSYSDQKHSKEVLSLS